jgi:hypothetical protein
MSAGQIDKDIDELFKDKQDAAFFLKLYGTYCSLIDDIIDENDNKRFIQRAFWMASEVYNCPYWNRYKHNLYPIDKIIQAEYFDSVVWENKENELWKREWAKVASHCFMLMANAVLMLEFPEDIRQKYSLRWKEFCYLKHKDDVI